ncbi:MAG: restriction modification system specificity protein [Bacteroidota bacterium]|nr:restriction modification system specificity protein [Bacteroidota bacterium]
MKWEKALLKDLVIMRYGKMPNKEDIVDEGYPIYSGYRITSYHKEYLYKEPQLIVVARGVGGTGDVKISPPFCYLTNLSIALLTNDSIVNRYFLKYRLSVQNLRSLDSGAAQSQITIGALEQFETTIPSLQSQCKIASILLAYDNLIENNLKRIKLLEEKARIEYLAIQKSEKLNIKKSFEVLQFTTGKLNSNAAVKNGLYPFFTCGQEILRTNTFSLDEEVVLLGGNNASAIYPVFYYKGKFDAYQRTYIIKPKPKFEISFKYLYFFWEDKLDYLKNISTGAATKFLTLKILNDIDIPLPNENVMKEFENLTAPIFNLKAILSEQNTKLREARDILLPRLMSGVIEV